MKDKFLRFWSTYVNIIVNLMVALFTVYLVIFLISIIFGLSFMTFLFAGDYFAKKSTPVLKITGTVDNSTLDFQDAALNTSEGGGFGEKFEVSYHLINKYSGPLIVRINKSEGKYFIKNETN